ncbi:hypothetical protein [Klebsiella pneumoniae]|uniref:hypothetical protein n=3 Tax=Klebsiella pneumoniae TaxID=573 RepID=UPI002FF2A0F9
MMKTMREHFPTRTVVIEQSLDMFGVKRNEDGTLLFPRHSDKRFPIARIRKRLAAYGWRGERLNKEVARIVAGPDIYAERNEYSIIFPYGWEKKQLTREMRRMFRHCCKVSDEAAFCLIQRPYISKTLLTRRISPRGSP